MDLRPRIAQAAALLGTDPSSAEQAARQLLMLAPADSAIQLILAGALRRLNRMPEALAVLEPLARAHPRAALTHFELGMARAGRGDDAGAVAALTQAVSLKPQMPQAWEALGHAHFRRGDEAAMQAAFANQLKHGLADPGLRAAADAMASGQLDAAQALLRDHLAAHPADVDALRMLGEILNRLERHAEAETVLAQALVIAPGFDGARFSYANALFQQQKTAAAIAQLRALLPKAPGTPAYRNLLAASLSLAGEFEEVEQLYAALAAEFPSQPSIWLNYANALKTIGQPRQAEAAYRRAAVLAPASGAAWSGLANFKTVRFSDADIAQMKTTLADPALGDVARLDFHAALGKAMEDRGQYADSFSHYEAAARLRRKRLAWPADANTARLRKSQALLTAEFFAARAGGGEPPRDPIFVLGLPRSGSTLIEQILSSHSSVEGTMELPEFGRAAAELARARGAADWLDCIGAVTADELAATGRTYLEAARLYRKTARPFFVDKMPNNFMHAGLIALALPNARIIDARRHPLAACFSAFKQQFAQGQAFSNDLTDLGLYYRDYVALMAHFDAVLPGRVLRVIYEDMVEDSEGQIRRLLAHCGLDFEDACLAFHKTERAVRTVSSEQVRQPIYRSGLEQWKAYEPWLGPLKNALGPALERWRQ